MSNPSTPISILAPVEHLVIFDPAAWIELAPLTFTRPACALRCGLGTLADNQIRAHRPRRVTLWARPELAYVGNAFAGRLARRYGIEVGFNSLLDDAPALLIDGRTFWFTAAPSTLGSVETDEVRQPLRFVLHVPGLTPDRLVPELNELVRRMPRQPCSAIVLRRPWDVIAHNRRAITIDSRWFGGRPVREEDHPHVAFLNRREIRIRREVKIAPGVVIDASEGPVCIEEGVRIGANAVIKGPCYLGHATQVLPLARIGPHTSAGRICKLAGEVGNTVVHGYANKTHDGFVGDSYLGAWVNLGAGTITSNMKNTYGPIRAATPFGRVQTDAPRLGTVFGDHAKTGIGTLLPAGSYVGVASQIAKPSPDAFTGSFRFVTPGADEPGDVGKLIATARTVAARRGVNWHPDDEALLRHAAETAGRLEKPA